MNKEKNRIRMREYRARKLAEAPPREAHPLWIWRKQNFLSIQEAGQVLGVTGTTIGYWERGVLNTPEWVMDAIRADAGYTERKIREIRAAHKEQLKTNRLLLWRKEHNASREEVGFYLDRAPRTVRAWELGERTLPGWVMKRLEVIDENLRKTENR